MSRMENRPTMFLATSRSNRFGKMQLHLINPFNGFHKYADEAVLASEGISLGDFLHATVNPETKRLENITKTTHTANLTVKVINDRAHVESIRVQLERLPGGELIYNNRIFPNCLCRTTDLPLGSYTIEVRELDSPVHLSNSKWARFEGVRPLPVRPGSNQSSTIVVGAGFENTAPTEKLKAVVLATAKERGVQVHYLWLLDKHSDCRFAKPSCELSEGHVFEGNFVRLQNGHYKCESYGVAVEGLVNGELDEKERCVFKVKVQSYQPKSFNTNYASGTTEHFGQILDVNGVLSKGCEGQEVKIQKRRGAEDREYFWMILEKV